MLIRLLRGRIEALITVSLTFPFFMCFLTKKHFFRYFPTSTMVPLKTATALSHVVSRIFKVIVKEGLSASTKYIDVLYCHSATVYPFLHFWKRSKAIRLQAGNQMFSHDQWVINAIRWVLSKTNISCKCNGIHTAIDSIALLLYAGPS